MLAFGRTLIYVVEIEIEIEIEIIFTCKPVKLRMINEYSNQLIRHKS